MYMQIITYPNAIFTARLRARARVRCVRTCASAQDYARRRRTDDDGCLAVRTIVVTVQGGVIVYSKVTHISWSYSYVPHAEAKRRYVRG